jgi:glucan biosynthesis protein C
MSEISSERMDWLDRVKTLMTVLVISVHAAVTYGSEGGWYYQESTGDMVTVVLLTMQNAVLQSFFMSLFFFISGYFIPKSLEKKGTGKFVMDKLTRLGLPCLAFFFALGPLTIWIAETRLEGLGFTYRDSVHIGPLWFAQALLIFTGIYLVLRRLISRYLPDRPIPATPSKKHLYLLFVFLAVATFLARWAWPMGEGIWGMQLGSFPQYIALFSLGILSRKRGWLADLSRISIPKTGGLALFGIVLLPVFMMFGEDPVLGLAPFMGGFYWQAGFYAIWESGMCIVMCLFILALYSRRNRLHTGFSREFSASAYTVYIIHPAVLLGLTLLQAGWEIHPLLKFASLLVSGTALSLFLGAPIRRLPGLKKVL